MEKKEMFLELTNTEELEIVGGGDVSIGGWVIDYCNMVGNALHDAFGCYKCGLHFF